MSFIVIPIVCQIFPKVASLYFPAKYFSWWVEYFCKIDGKFIQYL